MKKLKTDILLLGKEAITNEIAELQQLVNRLDENFSQAVTEIANGKGKLVVVGIGKSAHVATKLVATFNSTGTPSQFLHASEAIHGDLGLLRKEDVVICLSNSGNSPEIQLIVPYLNKNNVLIGITGNRESFLAKQSHYVIDASVTMESCPNNLAPTSSTLVQMAIGDALAVALMHARNFTEKDFAAFHPGGNLGKNLLWTVEHFISKSEKPSISSNASIHEVIVSLSSTKHGITVVLEDNTIVGVVTDGDLRRMLSKYDDFKNLQAKDIMSQNPKTISVHEKATTALEILQKYDIGQLVVVENSEFKGIVDLHQLLDEGIK